MKLTKNKPVFPREMTNTLAKVCEQLVIAQHNLNKNIRHDWPAANFPFLRAARAEINEAQGYTSWEWWKNLDQNWRDVFRTESDRDEFHMELVDALHFMVSALIQTFWEDDETLWGHWDLVNASQKLLGYLSEGERRSREGENRMSFEEGELGELPPESTLVRLEQLQFLLLNNDLSGSFHMLVELANHTGLGLQGLIGRYFAKGTLNVFRQVHGYKEKTYIKTWGDGKEDNFFLNRETIPYLSKVSLEELANRVATGSYQHDLAVELEQMYRRVQRNGHCDHEAAESTGKFAGGPAHGNPSGNE